MSNMEFCTFHDGDSIITNYVIPKSDCSIEEFEKICEDEADGYYTFTETKEGDCRWFPVVLKTVI